MGGWKRRRTRSHDDVLRLSVKLDADPFPVRPRKGVNQDHEGGRVSYSRVHPSHITRLVLHVGGGEVPVGGDWELENKVVREESRPFIAVQLTTRPVEEEGLEDLGGCGGWVGGWERARG